MAADQAVQPLRIELRHVAHDVDEPMRLEVAGMVIDAAVDLFLGRDRLELDHGEIAALGERAVLVEHIGDAARHAGGEVAAGGPSTTTTPPVMYSQQWSPAPSITAMAPELRTAKRSPATPRK